MQAHQTHFSRVDNDNIPQGCREGEKNGMVEGNHLGVECKGSFVRGTEWQVLFTRMINTKDNSILSEPRGKDGLIEVLSRTGLLISQ